MKLHHSPASPYVRKVMACAIARGLVGRIDLVSTNPHVSPPDLLADNPLSKVPALVADDGTAIYDSPVICEYLDSQHKGRKLFPRKGRERWMALRQQAMADGLLDAALLARYEGFLRPEEKRWPDWSKGQMKKIDGVLDQLEAESKALKGKPTIGTVSIGCALGYLDFRFADRNWREGHPRLAAWHAEFVRRPSVVANPVVDDS